MESPDPTREKGVFLEEYPKASNQVKYSINLRPTKGCKPENEKKFITFCISALELTEN